MGHWCALVSKKKKCVPGGIKTGGVQGLRKLEVGRCEDRRKSGDGGFAKKPCNAISKRGRERTESRNGLVGQHFRNEGIG